MKYNVAKIENGKETVLLSGTTPEKAEECMTLVWKTCTRSPKRYRITQREADRITFIYSDKGYPDTEITYKIYKCNDKK